MLAAYTYVGYGLGMSSGLVCGLPDSFCDNVIVFRRDITDMLLILTALDVISC